MSLRGVAFFPTPVLSLSKGSNPLLKEGCFAVSRNGVQVMAGNCKLLPIYEELKEVNEKVREG
ncbi:MAG: hypothetical protein MHPDNHAH_02831 [Anaerolineales bacterium]|nr:hypothetical protein [Anaerolineales bacterium]